MRSFSALAFRDFLIRRFSLTDLPDFFVADCRGDLSDMALPHRSIARALAEWAGYRRRDARSPVRSGRRRPR